MRSKISDLLEKINRVADPAAFSTISKIEFDLLMQHLRDLYEELDAIRNKRPAEIQARDEVHLPQPDNFVPRKTRPAEEILLQNDLRVKKAGSDSVKKEEPAVKSRMATNASLNETVESTETLNSKLKATSAKEVHHKLSSRPLKELIDLNKRFVLMNELFRGNADAFSNAILQIDSSEDFISAESFIRSSYISTYNWDESSQTVKLFFGLVKQRFGVE